MSCNSNFTREFHNIQLALWTQLVTNGDQLNRICEHSGLRNSSWQAASAFVIAAEWEGISQSFSQAALWVEARERESRFFRRRRAPQVFETRPCCCCASERETELVAHSRRERVKSQSSLDFPYVWGCAGLEGAEKSSWQADLKVNGAPDCKLFKWLPTQP
jgi:hypothetical protein